MRSTRKDVARLAGVSEATVSYVMNNTKPITAEVKKRVMDAVKELDYRPNLLAKSLVTRETRHVALLIDNMQNPYYCRLLEGVQNVAEKQGYIVSVVSPGTSDRKKILNLVSRGVDGVILAYGIFDSREYEDVQIPKVYVGDLVEVDYRQAIFDMVHKLKQEGHRKIAFLSGLPLEGPEGGHVRYWALKEAINHEGLEWDPQLIVDGNGITDEKEGKWGVDVLLERGVEFTALFAVNDLMAIGAMNRLWERGYGIPEDISIVGCDGIRVGEYLKPPLTTIDAHAYSTGQALMKTLIACMHPGEDKYQKKWVITGEFTERGSITKVNSRKNKND